MLRYSSMSPSVDDRLDEIDSKESEGEGGHERELGNEFVESFCDSAYGDLFG